MLTPKELLQQRLDEIEAVLKTVTKGKRGDMYIELKAHRDLYAITISHINIIVDNKKSSYNYSLGAKALANESEARIWLNKQKIKKKKALEQRIAKREAQARYRAKKKAALEDSVHNE